MKFKSNFKNILEGNENEITRNNNFWFSSSRHKLRNTTTAHN